METTDTRAPVRADTKESTVKQVGTFEVVPEIQTEQATSTTIPVITTFFHFVFLDVRSYV